MDALAKFKESQKQSWASFIPFELLTTAPAAQLVHFAGIRSGQRVLDVGCGTGVVAITAANKGAVVTGLDLTPELLARAKDNAATVGVTVTWQEGDAEALPFEDGVFDVVVSQFGHMFAPRPEIATREMLRVLKAGGTIAFSTWPPELFTGKMFALVAQYLPPPPIEVSPPPQWGNPEIVRQRLGAAVRNLTFDTGRLAFPTLGPAHFRAFVERNAGPVLRVVQTLAGDPARLDAFRKEFDALARLYFDQNVVHQDYLMTRAEKA
ncbi:class I SAM-dependent methyltransferase [Candidatus Nitrospira bockiana]